MKAERMVICAFYNTLAQKQAADRIGLNAILPVMDKLTQAQKEVVEFFGLCDYNESQNAVIVNRALEVVQLPVVRVLALYPGGGTAEYWLTDQFTTSKVNSKVHLIDFSNGDDFSNYFHSLYNFSFQQNEISLCDTIINPVGKVLFGVENVCGSISATVWLAIAALSAYKTINSKTKMGQYGFGAATLLAGNEYLKRK